MSSRRVAVISSCSARSSARRSFIRSTSTAPSSEIGMGSLLGRVGEEPAPVELCCLDEGQELIVVGLGLARVADDEVRSERRVGLAPPDVVDATQEAVAVAPSTHPTQQRLADVLEGEIEVRHAGRADRVDQCVGQVARVQVQQPHPVGAIGDGLDERHDRAGAEVVGPVLAVRGEVLGDEHDLASLELVDLGRGSGRCRDCAAAHGSSGSHRTHTSGRTPRRS